jgi:hypothetical protein
MRDMPRRSCTFSGTPTTVQHVEKIKQEVVLGEVYEIWDVTTDKDRCGS